MNGEGKVVFCVLGVVALAKRSWIVFPPKAPGQEMERHWGGYQEEDHKHLHGEIENPTG